MIDRCKICEQMTEWYLKENPDKKGCVLCEQCYENSKEFFYYMNEAEIDVSLKIMCL